MADREKTGSSINAGMRPPPKEVSEFHTNDDVDTSSDAHHHTLGPGANQASPGSHRHDGSDSSYLLDGYIISGSKTTGAALSSVIAALVLLGAKDEST